jgi:hypothetical protein
MDHSSLAHHLGLKGAGRNGQFHTVTGAIFARGAASGYIPLRNTGASR